MILSSQCILDMQQNTLLLKRTACSYSFSFPWKPCSSWLKKKEKKAVIRKCQMDFKMTGHHLAGRQWDSQSDGSCPRGEQHVHAVFSCSLEH